jgi:hypothetical protein
MAKLDLKKAAMKTAGIGAGVLASNYVGNKFLSNANPKLVGAGKILVGSVILPMLSKGKGGVLESVGDGIIADGVYQLGNSMAPDSINGYGREQGVGAIYPMEEDRVNGGSDEFTDANARMNGWNNDGASVGNDSENAVGSDD